MVIDPGPLVHQLREWLGRGAGPALVRVVHAPGRVNVIGEHTDYNEGFVLPAAIDLGITVAFVPRSDRRVRLRVRGRRTRQAELELDGRPERLGDWRDYVAGTGWALGEAGASLNGFDGLLASDLPSGAGLSSSAALELAVAWALSGGRPPLPDPMAVALAARRAENEIVDVPSGLMDPFAVACGVDGAALLLDCRSLEHRAVPIPPGAALVIADSGVPRGLRASAYAERRAQCERAVAALRRREPGLRSLRDATPGLLEAAAADLDGVELRRARHVVGEDERVLVTAAALEAGDLPAAGRQLLASHASLRDDFDVSSPALDRLVELAMTVPGAFGSRLTGAGFGGSTVTLVRDDAVDDLREALESGYRTPDGQPPLVRRVRPSTGAHAIEGRAGGWGA